MNTSFNNTAEPSIHPSQYTNITAAAIWEAAHDRHFSDKCSHTSLEVYAAMLGFNPEDVSESNVKLNEYCQQVLKEHFPDLTKLTKDTFSKIYSDTNFILPTISADCIAEVFEQERIHRSFSSYIAQHQLH